MSCSSRVIFSVSPLNFVDIESRKKKYLLNMCACRHLSVWRLVRWKTEGNPFLCKGSSARYECSGCANSLWPLKMRQNQVKLSSKHFQWISVTLTKQRTLSPVSDVRISKGLTCVFARVLPLVTIFYWLINNLMKCRKLTKTATFLTCILKASISNPEWKSRGISDGFP